MNYFQDVFELQKEAVKPGEKAVIVDDLLATGGLSLYILVIDDIL